MSEVRVVFYIHVYAMYMYLHIHGFESYRGSSFFLWKSDCLGCVDLLCFVVCMTLLASFSLPSASLINMYT